MQTSRPSLPLALFLSVLLLLLTPAVALPQGPNVTAQLGTLDTGAFPKVSSTVSVVNGYGVAVPGLGNADFTLLEDARSVPVAASSFTDPNVNVAVCLVLDTSLSMRGKPLEDAKAAANAFLDLLGPNDRACLVAFSATVDVGNPPNIDDTREVNFTTDRNKIRNVLDGLKAEGGTALYDAAVAGIKLTSTQNLGTRAVVLFTDGQDCGNADCTKGASISREGRPAELAQQSRIPVFTIGFGREIDQAFLRRLAEETGGTYQQTPDSTKLAQLFENIATQLKTRYRVEYNSPLAPDTKEHNLQLTVRTPLGETQATVKYQLAKPPPIFVRMYHYEGKDKKLTEDGQKMRGIVLLAPEISLTTRNAISTTTFIIDGKPFPVIQAPWEYSWNTCDVPVGAHSVQVIAQDDLQQAGQATISVATVSSGLLCIISDVVPTEAKVAIGGLGLLLLLLLLGLVIVTRRRRDELIYQPVPGPATVPGITPPISPITPPITPFEPAPTPLDTRPRPAPGRKGDTVLIPGDDFAPATSRDGTQTQIFGSDKGLMPGFLVMERGSHRGHTYDLRRGDVSLGRSGENDIIVDDGKVSRKQAKIRFEDGSLFLYDLAATNTTEVNGKKLTEPYKLQENDRIQMGETVFVFKQIATDNK